MDMVRVRKGARTRKSVPLRRLVSEVHRASRDVRCESRGKYQPEPGESASPSRAGPLRLAELEHHLG